IAAHHASGMSLVCMAVLSACSAEMPGPDRLELATIPRWKEVPRSTPATFVRTFDTFCVERPARPEARESALRSAGYVPRPQQAAGAPRVFVVDDLRPAVLSGARICGVRAVSRTGQTEAVQGYVAKAFPEARPASPAPLGSDVEQAWQVEGGMLATTRNHWVGNAATYTLLLYRPDA
ncbi:MAG: hypothetical protein RIG84_16980, partial [Roseovarius sp.]